MNMIAVERRDGQWWIRDEDDPEPIGPYKTRAEAEDDARGLRRFYRWGHLREFVTTGSYALGVLATYYLLNWVA